MIWESVALMTLLDLGILGISVAALWIIIRRRHELQGSDSGFGPWAIAIGLLAIGLLYLADLFTMWVLPVFVTREAAVQVMQDLHLNYSWTVVLIAVSTVLLGLTRTVRSLSDQALTLKRREERYRSLYEKTPVMLHSTDPTGRLLSVSDRWLETLGYSREEVIGRRGVEFLSEASREYTESVCLPKFLETGVLEDEPLQFRKAGGGSVDVLLSAIAEKDSTGGVARSLVVSIDVTARKRAEAELATLRRRNELILEAGGEGIYGVDSEGNTTFVNPAAARMLGWEPGELIGQCLHNVRHHSRPGGPPYPIEECPIYAAFTDGTVHRVEDEVFWRKDGSSFAVEYTSTPIREEGRLVGAVVMFRDVTEAKRAKAALADSEAQYRGVFEASVHGLTIRRLGDGALVAANSAAARMHGYSVEEFTRLSPEDYLPPQTLDEFEGMVETVTRGETYYFDTDAPNRHEDGRLVYVDACAVPFPYRGEPHVLGILRDVTTQRQTEREREQAIEQIARLKDELERERDYLREEVKVSLAFGEIVGRSAEIGQVLARIEAVAPTDANVLILGESGVGKELVARAIHAHSPRDAGALVKVNCAAIPRELFESEFFGHVRGAFSGAHQDRVGRFPLADGGTLFLDELAEIPFELQAKLLRVIEEGEYVRVGEDTARSVDVRVLAATNRDLEAEIEAGRFRKDLYFRLSVFPLEVPPLRERREDILPLATHFLKLACRDFGREEKSFTRFQADALLAYDWPGNIRELRNVIERAVILSPGQRVRLDLALPRSDLAGTRPPPVRDGGQKGDAFVTAAEIKRRERDNLIAALEQAGWRVAGATGAARLLGLKPSTLRYQMKAMGIQQGR